MTEREERPALKNDDTPRGGLDGECRERTAGTGAGESPAGVNCVVDEFEALFMDELREAEDDEIVLSTRWTDEGCNTHLLLACSVGKLTDSVTLREWVAGEDGTEVGAITVPLPFMAAICAAIGRWRAKNHGTEGV